MNYLHLFPGDVKEGFYLSKVDYQYVIHDGLGPYFKQILVFCLNIQNSEKSFNILQFPESEKSINSVDLLIRYWSDTDNSVRFLKATKFAQFEKGRNREA